VVTMKALLIAAVAVALAGAATVLALLLAASDSSNGGMSGPTTGPYRGSRPPAGIRAPDFTLRDYRGQIVRMTSLRGRIVLTTFVDSACHESCPIILARRILRQRGHSARSTTSSARPASLRPVWKAYGILPAVDTGSADVHSADVRIF